LHSEPDPIGPNEVDDVLPENQLSPLLARDRSHRTKSVLELSWAEFDRLVQ
jgi:hypothetical protein